MYLVLQEVRAGRSKGNTGQQMITRHFPAYSRTTQPLLPATIVVIALITPRVPNDRGPDDVNFCQP
jgi:hypothetical protein